MAAVQLTKLAHLEALSPLVFRVLGCNPGPMTLQGTNTYLVGSGRRKILIDTGERDVPEYTNNLLAALKQLGGAVIDRIVCTHWHHDHVGGVADILAALGFGPDGTNRNSTPPAVHKLPRLDKRKEDFSYDYVSDNHVFKTDGVTLRVLYTPGHSDDHICLYFEEENAIFSGDSILGEGTTTFEDLHSYMQSLEKLIPFRPTRIYPGHGTVVEDGLARIKQYIDHRLQRERQIVDVLQSSDRAMTSYDIVGIIYEGLIAELVPAAVRNVKHHLRKLEKDGKVVKREEDKWVFMPAKL